LSTHIKSIKNLFLFGYSDLQKPPSSNIPGLDVMRSLAILLVVSGHYFGEYSSKVKLNTDFSTFPLFVYAWTGVDLFFVLSGFLIGKQLWKELRDEGTINIPRFLIRRGLRIWPYYYAFVIFTIFTSTTPLKSFIPDVLFFSNYVHNHIAGGWSLSTEEQFYILMPVLLLIGTKFIPIRYGYLIPIAFFIILPIGRYFIFTSHSGIITDELRINLTYSYFHTHSDGLVAGLLIAWVNVVKRNLLNKIPFKKNIILPCALIILGIVLRKVNNFIFAFTSLGLIFGGIAIFMLRDNSKLSIIFRWHGFYLLSRLSYGMYLNHFPVLWWGLPIFLTIPFVHSSIVFFVGYILIFILSAAISSVSFLTIESPFLYLRKCLFSK